MVLFADDTSIIITDTNRRDFNVNANQTFQDINTWFKVNLLTLNLNKTQYSEIKFLGLTTDDTLSWKHHTEQVHNTMCTACYALGNIHHIVPIDTLRVI